MGTTSFLILCISLVLFGHSAAPLPAQSEPIRLTEINGATTFIDTEGRVFRALGVNHFASATKPAVEIIADLKQWGSNTPDELAREFVHPKALNLVNVSRWMLDDRFKFRDVFSVEFKLELESRIRTVCLKHREFPLLIGYFWNDIPIWGDTDHPEGGWLSFFQSLPADSAGHRAWRTWRRKHAEAPESEFLGIIAGELYRTAHEYFKKYDPDSLILGDKYSESDMPEVVVRAALPYIDVLFIQVTSREFDPAYFTSLHQRYGKPIYISDHVGGFSTPEYPHTITRWTWPNAKDYATYYQRYITAAFAHPNLIGYIRCQYRSVPRKGKLDTQKQGLLRMDGTPYTEILPTVSAANREAQARFRKSLTP